MENVPPTRPNENTAGLRPLLRWLAWAAVAVVLLGTFAGYQRIEMLLHWVAVTLC